MRKDRCRDEAGQDIRHHRSRNTGLNWNVGKKHQHRHENDTANSDASNHQARSQPKKHDPNQTRYCHSVTHLSCSLAQISELCAAANTMPIVSSILITLVSFEISAIVDFSPRRTESIHVSPTVSLSGCRCG